jgi:hypothetical protein
MHGARDLHRRPALRKRHDAVAHQPVDGSFVKPNGRDHPVENRIEQTARIIRIAVGDELRRADDVRKQQGDVLTLLLSAG